MNTAVTIAPRRINSAVTVAPGCGVGAGLAAGEVVGDGFVVGSVIGEGSQARVYMAMRAGRSFVVKVYGEGFQPSDRLRSFLRAVEHPNIARVVDLGTSGGRYYEVYEYFHEGTLEKKGALPLSHIQSVIVPSINEGLHELHSSGLVHCDIKPSNLFYAGGGSRVVIGDCGVSGYVNASGRLVGQVRGTPEYSPRVKMMGGKAVISPAYDYCSFGLVLCRVLTGMSLFAGLSEEEIALAYDEGIEWSDKVSGRIGTLIKALVTEDEEKRWGYEEVRRWCEGEFIRPAGRRLYNAPKKPPKAQPLIFGRYGGETLKVSTGAELVRAVRAHWDQGARLIKRRELAEFLLGLEDGEELYRRALELAKLRDPNAALFELMAMLDDSGGMCYMDRCYRDLGEFVDALASGTDQVAREIVLNGLFIRYLRIRGKDKELVDRLEKLILRSGGDLSAVLTVCCALKGGGGTEVFGRSVSDLDGVVRAIADRSTKEIDRLLRDEGFLAWLNTKGFDREARRIRDQF